MNSLLMLYRLLHHLSHRVMPPAMSCLRRTNTRTETPKPHMLHLTHTAQGDK